MQRNHLARDHLVGNAVQRLRNRGRRGDIHPRLGFQLLVDLNKLHQVRNILLLFGPVLRLGVVGAQHDDHDVRIAGAAFPVAALFPIGKVAGLEQRRAARAAIVHLVAFAQQLLQLRRIAVQNRRRRADPLGDTVPHTGHHIAFRHRFGRLSVPPDGQCHSAYPGGEPFPQTFHVCSPFPAPGQALFDISFHPPRGGFHGRQLRTRRA